MFLLFAGFMDREFKQSDLTDGMLGLVIKLYDAQPYEADFLAYTDEVEVMAGTLAARSGIPILLGNLCRLLIKLRKDRVLPKKPGRKNHPWTVFREDLTENHKKIINELYMSHKVRSDDLPYTRELEWMALTFMARTGMMMSLGNFFYLIIMMRKKKELRRKCFRDDGGLAS